MTTSAWGVDHGVTISKGERRKRDVAAAVGGAWAGSLAGEAAGARASGQTRTTIGQMQGQRIVNGVLDGESWGKAIRAGYKVPGTKRMLGGGLVGGVAGATAVNQHLKRKRARVSKSEDMSRRQQLNHNRKIRAEHQQREGGRGALVGLGAGAAAGLGARNARALTYGTRAAGKLYQQGHTVKTSVRGGRNLARWTNIKVGSGKLLRLSNMEAGFVGGTVGTSVGNHYGQKRGAKKAEADPRLIRDVKPIQRKTA